MKHVLRVVSISLATIAAAIVFGAVTSARANHGFFWKIGPDLGKLDCTPGNNAYFHEDYSVNFSAVMVPDDYGMTVTNQRTGTSTSHTFSGLSTYSQTDKSQSSWYSPIPAGTQSGDVLIYTFYWTLDGKSAITNSGIGWVCDTGEVIPLSDGRINWQSAKSGPVALYCDDDILQVWDIDPVSGEGTLAFTFSDWSDEAPAVNTLLVKVGDVELWHLDTGEYQVNARPYEDGKLYGFIFNGCPYNGGGYKANLDPNE